MKINFQNKKVVKRVPNIIKIFINWSNYLVYEYLGLKWWQALLIALGVYLICFICENLLKLMKKSKNQFLKFLTKDLFLKKE